MSVSAWVFVGVMLGLPGVAVTPQRLPAAPVVPPAEAATPSAAGLESLVLVGLVSSPDSARSSAVLRCGERTRVVGAGDTFCGARVVGIEAGRLQIEVEGRRRVLPLSSAPAAPPVAPPALPGAGAGVQEGALFTRAELERRIADETPRLLAETALIPVAEDGRTNGFVFSRVPENSLLTDLGLRAGDVLSEINGTPIDSMATLLALYARLQGSSEIRATVLRGGSSIPLVVYLH